MAKPITDVPFSATAEEANRRDSAAAHIEAILDQLEQAGAWRILRALLEQRQPIAEMVVRKINTQPTKRGLKNAITLAMGIGELPDGFGADAINALQSGLAQARAASESTKISFWQLRNMLKDPDVARAIHYLMGFLKGIGSVLDDLNEQHPGP